MESTIDVQQNSSSAPQSPEQIDLSSFSKEQRQEWRNTGKLPEPKKADAPAASEEKPKADSAPAKESSEPEKAEAAPDPESGKHTQEPRKAKAGAEERIKELLAENKRLKAEREAKTEVKAESSPAPQPVQPQFTRPKPTADDKNPDGSPKYKTLEELFEDVAD